MNKSLSEYRGSGYGKINKLLRSNTIPTGAGLTNLLKESKKTLEYDTLKHIQNIDNAMKSHNYSKLILYRGITGIEGKYPGDTITHTNYLSTSLFRESAAKFMDKCCIVYFYLPSTMKIHEYKDKQTAKNVEGEILVERNTQFIIKEVIDNTYFAELVHYTPPTKIPRRISNMVLEVTELDEKIKEFIADNIEDEMNDTVEEWVDDFLRTYKYYNNYKTKITKLFKKYLN